MNRIDSTLTEEKHCSTLLKHTLTAGFIFGLIALLHYESFTTNTSKLSYNCWRPKKTRESWLSWTVLHSQLTSTPFNIYGNTWRPRKPNIFSFRVHAVIKARVRQTKYLDILTLTDSFQCEFLRPIIVAARANLYMPLLFVLTELSSGSVKVGQSYRETVTTLHISDFYTGGRWNISAWFSFWTGSVGGARDATCNSNCWRSLSILMGKFEYTHILMH